MSKLWVFSALRMEPADFMASFGFPQASDTGEASLFPAQIYFPGLRSQERRECFSMSAPDHKEKKKPLKHFTDISKDSAKSILSRTKLHFMKLSLFRFICQAGLLRII